MHTPYRSALPPTPVSDSIAPGLKGQIGMRDVGLFLWGAAGSIVICAVIFVTAALAYVMTTPSTYTANAQLMVEIRATPNLFDSNGRLENQTDSARVDSQVEIIKSDRIATAVINELRLMDNPEFAAPNSWLRILRPSWLGEGTVDRTELQTRYAAAIFGDHLSTRRVGRSLVIDVSFRSRDPDLAAQIANALVNAYLSEDVAAKSESAGRGSKWLAERIGELRRQAFQAQLAAGRFKLVGNTESAEESQVKLLELESIAQSYRRMYEEFLQKFAETVQLVSYPEADARIITSAAKPLEPSHPRSKLIVLFAMLLGGTVGAGWSLARQSLDRTARSPDQIIQETGFDCLGTIALHSQTPESYGSLERIPVVWNHLASLLRSWPGLSRPPRSLRRGASTIGVAETSSATTAQCDSNRSKNALINVLADGAPPALVGDLRGIKVSINSATLGAGPQSIGVASCGGGDGASMIAANLAFLYAISGKRTLLVDCCPLNPTISRQFAPGTEVGLAEALEDASLLEGVLASREAQKCAFLPIGKPNPLVSPAERIASDKSAFRFDDLKSDFDMILLDLPSLQASSDAREIAPRLDGIILVASYGSTSVDLIRHYGAAIKASQVNVLGVVLNKVGPTSCRDVAGH
jgi:succinoglycan biosynthesis transport protein ExoP